MFFSFQCSDICPRRKPVITNEKRKTKSIVNYYNKENPINEAKFAWFNLFLSHKEYFCIVSQADRVVAKEAHSLFLFVFAIIPEREKSAKNPPRKVSGLSFLSAISPQIWSRDERWGMTDVRIACTHARRYVRSFCVGLIGSVKLSVSYHEHLLEYCKYRSMLYVSSAKKIF